VRQSAYDKPRTANSEFELDKEDKVRRTNVELILGIFLVAGGALVLLQNLGLIPETGLFWSFAFLFGGLVFLYTYLANREHWWALIPGFTLLGIGGTIAISELAPDLADVASGAMVLGGISLGFWVIYLTDIDRWWALIPGGVLLTLAVVTVIDTLGGALGGGVFFLGLGLTFLLLWILPTPDRKMGWALIPAAVLLLIGLLMSAATASLINYAVPALFILLGAYFLLRTFTARREA
jgi:hypothetical protein